jgi:hypothetical protein
VPAAHGLPDVLHDVLSGAQTLLLQAPEQHWPATVHAPLSAVHCCALHWLFTHAPVQHSVPATQAPPAVLHPVFAPHVFGPPSAAAKQFPLQQSVSAAHASFIALHASASGSVIGPSVVVDPSVLVDPSVDPSVSFVIGTSVSSLPQPVAKACDAARAKTPTATDRASFFIETNHRAFAAEPQNARSSAAGAFALVHPRSATIAPVQLRLGGRSGG